MPPKKFHNLLNDVISNCLNPIDNLVISAAGPKSNNSIKMTNQKFKIDELGSKYIFTLLYCFLEKILLNTKVK